MRAYTARREINRLRRRACTLWQTPGVAQVITRVEVEIERKALIIRKDRSINKDVGMKKGFLELLLSYNPLWLKVGLETVYGEVLSFAGGAADMIGLSQFVVTRMLSNPEVLSEFAHPTVPHHYSSGCEDALKQFTLKKFLQLVFFLDQAKLYRIIKHNPCLFHKDSKFKQSKDVVTAFSRDFLAGEGDVVKHLGFLGYNLTHKQTALDEFDYAVTNLALDLKDGVRLCAVMEFLLSSSGVRLSDRLRMPVVSRLQKVHNVDVALSALKSSHAGLPASLSARDIVDGHLEKTLGLMWHIIFAFQLDLILDEERLQREVDHLRKSLRYRAQIRDREALAGEQFVRECMQRELADEAAADAVKDPEDDWAKSSKMKLLLWWTRLVCAHYGIEVQ
jgi:abnormal spindle-like microcephaly-associated protein